MASESDEKCPRDLTSVEKIFFRNGRNPTWISANISNSYVLNKFSLWFGGFRAILTKIAQNHKASQNPTTTFPWLINWKSSKRWSIWEGGVMVLGRFSLIWLRSRKKCYIRIRYMLISHEKLSHIFNLTYHIHVKKSVFWKSSFGFWLCFQALPSKMKFQKIKIHRSTKKSVFGFKIEIELSQRVFE